MKSHYHLAHASQGFFVLLFLQSQHTGLSGPQSRGRVAEANTASHGEAGGLSLSPLLPVGFDGITWGRIHNFLSRCSYKV